ncbi:MAG: hypothetical protein IKW03_02480 [Clostridia bacterium]|nr:hypothetical protein [Clostridia bacterium]
MRKFKRVLSVILAVMMTVSCMAVSVYAEEEDEISLVGTKGNFNLISYNVAGLPIPSSETDDGKDALLDTIEIGGILNALKYDIVAVQEDFNYDSYLRDLLTNYPNIVDNNNVVTERHQTVHSGGVPLGDGLNIFSTYALYNEDREEWEESAGILDDGADELTYKGILLSTIEVAEGYYVDIYNIHADAYGGTASQKARIAQFKQLEKFIKNRSVYDPETGVYDHAVIVTGDFNASICREEQGEATLIKYLLEPAKLNDAWAVQTISEITENPETYEAYYTYAKETDMTYEETMGHYDSVERICFADGNGIDLSFDNFAYQFINGVDGESLSDHPAVVADFTFEIIEKIQDVGVDHDKENVQAEKGFLLRFLDYIASLFRAIGKLLQGLGKNM